MSVVCMRLSLTPISGTGHHSVKVFNVNGTPLSTFQPHSNFLHQNRSAPISTVTFHPHHMQLACAALNDNHINLTACQAKLEIPLVVAAA